MGATHPVLPSQEILTQWRHGYGSSQDATPEGAVVVPMYKSVQLYSATATASFTAAATTGLGYFTHADVYIRVAATGGTSATLDLFLDSRLDGTNWVNLGHVTQLSTIFGQVVRLGKPVSTALEFGTVGADAGAGTIRNIAWGDDLRVRGTLSGGTTSPLFDLAVTVNLHT